MADHEFIADDCSDPTTIEVAGTQTAEAQYRAIIREHVWFSGQLERVFQWFS